MPDQDKTDIDKTDKRYSQPESKTQLTPVQFFGIFHGLIFVKFRLFSHADMIVAGPAPVSSGSVQDLLCTFPTGWISWTNFRDR